MKILKPLLSMVKALYALGYFVGVPSGLMLRREGVLVVAEVVIEALCASTKVLVASR
jgi:hypothetical protein